MELTNLFLFDFGSTEELIRYGGVALLCAIIFMETGLLLGLIIPGGDSLLFTTGLLTATGVIATDVKLLIPLLIISGILGDMLGYYLGKKSRDSIHTRPDSWYFKQKHLEKAENFYHKKGKTALIIGKFMPVVRTFNPFISGITKLKWSTYLGFTSLGSSLWICSLVLAGYFIGNRFPEIKNYISFIIPGIIIVSLVPVIFQYFKSKQKNN